MLRIAAVILTCLLASSLFAGELRLTSHNTVTLRGPVTDESVQEVQMAIVEKVAKRRSPKAPIFLVLDTPGGSVDAGEALIQHLKKVPNLHTVTIFAASMGAIIAQSLPGKRYMVENGIMMFHRASGTFRGQFESGEVESQLKLWQQIIRNIEVRISKRIGIPLSTYKSLAYGEWWVYGPHSVKEGVSDEVSDIVCSQKLIADREVRVVRSLFGTYKAYFSKCPLIRGQLPDDQ